MKKLLMALLATVLLWSGPTAAQQKPNLRILVEAVDENATRCGVTASGIESIATLTLRNNGIQMSTSYSKTFLYVQTAVLATAAGGCAISLHVAVQTHLPMSPKGTDGFKNRKYPNLATASLCEEGWFSISPQGQAAPHFSQSLENTIKLCLGQLDY